MLGVVEGEAARMEQGLEEIAVAGLVRRLDAHQRDVGVVRRLGDPHGVGQRGAVEPLDVDARVTPKGQHVVVVLQQDEGARLCRVAELHELRSADDVGGGPGVDVRVVEQAEPELVP